VAAVVLNYRTPDDTLLAVRSLIASRRRADIVVVDNDESDRCLHALDPVLPDVQYVNAGRNLGFSGGVNVGIRNALDAGADAVVLVNSDVFVPPDCLGRLEAALDRRRDAGIVAPVVVARSDPGRVATLGMAYHPLTGRMRHHAVGRRTSDVPARGERDVHAASGCMMLITREVFDAIGLFDEDYFFTFEDLDFCLRARRAGFATIIATDARAYHEGSRSIGAASPLRLYFAARNHLLLAARSDPQRRGLSAWLRNGSIVALNVAHAVLSRSGSLGSRLLAVAEGTRDYAMGAYGVGVDAGRVAR
jgi:GT2 family glycosyltransferase